MIDPTTVDPMPEYVEYDDLFWDSRAVLQHIRDYARARLVFPWGVLGVSMVHSIAQIPHDVTLPPTIGGKASLNLFVGLVGRSGKGKGACEAASRDAFMWNENVAMTPIGTGEGVARTYRPLGTKPDDRNPITTAVFSAAEIDSWSTLAARQGSTITTVLRQLFMGETIGFANAGKDTRVIVAAHSYRACLIAGIQPLRSAPLLNAADGGMPQRVLWLPMSDPDAPERIPDTPAARFDPTPDNWSGAFELTIPTSVHNEIVTARQVDVRTPIDAAPCTGDLDGHALLTRMKAAAGLMALDGRIEMDEEDWQLAGMVMDVSNQTREVCRQAIANDRSRENKAKAHAQAEREAIIDVMLSETKQKRVAKVIFSKFKKASPLTRLELYRVCDSSIRGDFETVLDILLDQGSLVSEGGEGQAERFRLKDG